MPLVAHCRIQFAIIALVFSVSIFPVVTVHAARPSIVEDCKRVVKDYAWYFDHPGPAPRQTAQKFADLFTDKAELVVIDDNLDERSYVGRKPIIVAYLESRQYYSVLYITSNIRITPTSDKTAVGTSYVSFYLHADTGSMKDEGTIKGVYEYRDEYLITDAGCKFSKRKTTLRLINQFGIIEKPDPE